MAKGRPGFSAKPKLNPLEQRVTRWLAGCVVTSSGGAIACKNGAHILHEICSLSQHQASPVVNHVKQLLQIFSHLENKHTLSFQPHMNQSPHTTHPSSTNVVVMSKRSCQGSFQGPERLNAILCPTLGFTDWWNWFHWMDLELRKQLGLHEPTDFDWSRTEWVSVEKFKLDFELTNWAMQRPRIEHIKEEFSLPQCAAWMARMQPFQIMCAKFWTKLWRCSLATCQNEGTSESDKWMKSDCWLDTLTSRFDFDCNRAIVTSILKTTNGVLGQVWHLGEKQQTLADLRSIHDAKEFWLKLAQHQDAIRRKVESMQSQLSVERIWAPQAA